MTKDFLEDFIEATLREKYSYLIITSPPGSKEADVNYCLDTWTTNGVFTVGQEILDILIAGDLVTLEDIRSRAGNLPP